MYVDTFYDKDKNIVNVVERKNGERVYRTFDPDHHFYVDDIRGSDKTIYGNPVKRVNPKSIKDKYKTIRAYKPSEIWESDINPVLRCLENEYLHADLPDLQVAFFDIEVGFDDEYGYSQPEDSLNPIISIAIHMQWMEETICLALPPEGMSKEEAEKIASEIGNVVIMDTEAQLLDCFLDVIKDADVLSGWNSEGYDIIYVVNRVTRLLGKHDTRRLCLWDLYPEKKTVQDGPRSRDTFSLVGRVHMDYLVLYKNFTFEAKQSYALDSIAEIELDDRKVPYDGTLDQLYKKDFKKFLEYNIQDTELLDRLDKKLQYIDLANGIAHDSVVRLQSSLGAVMTTECSIICEAHANGLVVPNKTKMPEDFDPRAAGGWVSCAQSGLHSWVGSSDLNSLYPSVIRALNMSPETIVAQVRTDETASALKEWESKGSKSRYNITTFWNDKFNTQEMERFFKNKNDETIKLDLESGETHELSGAELRSLIFDCGKPWVISANGTIFSTEKQGIVPKLLERWYNERKKMQGFNESYKKLIFDDKNEGIPIDDGLFNNETDIDHLISVADGYKVTSAFDEKVIRKYIENKDVESIKNYMNQHRLHVVGGKVVGIDVDEINQLIGFWFKRQLVRKINLNSVYGGLLNEHHRFFDQRIGQSTTLTGRCITRHMTAKTNEVFTGEYDYKGITVLYNDTDSCVGNTMIETSLGKMSIEDLFLHKCEYHEYHGEKEYGMNPDLMVLSYDDTLDEPYMGHINYVYRHKVSKDLYEIEDESGNTVIVTEDHSIMVKRNGIMLEAKPADIHEDDIIISVNISDNAKNNKEMV